MQLKDPRFGVLRFGIWGIIGNDVWHEGITVSSKDSSKASSLQERSSKVIRLHLVL